MTALYSSSCVFGTDSIGRVIYCCDVTYKIRRLNKKYTLKKLLDIWKKIRKLNAPPEVVHRDKKKYSRKEKFKKSLD